MKPSVQSLAVIFFLSIIGFTRIVSAQVHKIKTGSFEATIAPAQNHFSASKMMTLTAPPRFGTTAKLLVAAEDSPPCLGAGRIDSGNTGVSIEIGNSFDLDIEITPIPTPFQSWYENSGVSLAPDSEFSIVSDNCLGVTLIPGEACHTIVRFTPKSVGLKAFNLTYVYNDSDEFGGHCIDTFTLNISMSAIAPKILPPTNSQNSCRVPVHSAVDIDRLALQETLPLTGVPFSLSYSSDRFRDGFHFSQMSLGLGSWSPDILHRYDVAAKIIYFGDGGLRPVEAQSTANGYYLPNAAGTEIYYFDINGIHNKTLDALTGVLKFAFSYDAQMRLTSVSDQFGNTSTMTYSDHEVLITSPYGQVTRLNLDENGFLAALSNPKNETHLMSYSVEGYLLSQTKPEGQTSQVSYNAAGFVTKDEGAGGDFISFLRVFDAETNSQAVVSSTALNRQTLYQTLSSGSSSAHDVVNPSGEVIHFTNEDQGSNTWINSLGIYKNSTLAEDPRFGWMAPYESMSNSGIDGSHINLTVGTTATVKPASLSDPLNYKTLTKTVTLQNNRVYQFKFELGQKLFTNLSPMNRVSYKRLDNKGQVHSLQTGSLMPFVFNYDNRGRVISISQENRHQFYSWNAQGNLSKSIDPLGQITHYEYDAANRLIKKTKPDGAILQMTYDKNGNLTSLTPPLRPKHQFSYNLVQLMSEYLPPTISSALSGATQYSYSLDQELIQITRPDGAQVQLSYDPSSGLLSSVAGLQGEIIYNYYPETALVSSVISPDQEITSYQYIGDIPELITMSGAVQGGIRFAYNSDSSLAELQVLGGTRIPFSYDKDGLLTLAYKQRFSRNNVGAVSNSQIDKITASLSYDKFGALIKNQFVANKKSIFSYDFERDLLGRIVKVNELNMNYDKQGRLEKVSTDKGRKTLRQYIYDKNGNRIQKIEADRVIKAQYDSQDRLLKYGHLEFQYNQSGEIWAKIEYKHKKHIQTHYSYDAFGNLKSVQLPQGKFIEYIIDGNNRRVGKKLKGKFVQGFIYQSQTQIAAELNEHNKVIKQFVYGEKANIPDLMLYKGKVFRIISDQVGTPKLIVDVATGKVVRQYSFDEFGIELDHPGSRKSDEAVSIPFGFAGGLYDKDTGLVRFGARDYDPETGRWTSKDPILFNGGDTNLYGYVANDPVNWTDPSGLLHPNKQPPATVMPTGPNGAAAQCFETCMGGADLLVTGGQESSGHTNNSKHYSNNACDFAGPDNGNPNLNDPNKVKQCAKSCGYTNGQFESFPNNPNRNHWHFQTQPGNGVPGL